MTTTTKQYRIFFLSLYVLVLCGLFVMPVRAQNESATDSNIQIDTSVLKNLSQRTYQPGSYSPGSKQLHLRQPVSNGSDWLTNKTKSKSPILNSPQNKAITSPLSPPTTTPLPITQQDIIKGRDITAKPRIIPNEKTHEDDSAKLNAETAPTPVKKPVAAIKTAKAEKLAKLPIPKRRPTIQQASKSFVEKERSRIAVNTSSEQLVPPTVRKTVPMDPRILQDAPKSMPAERPEHVASEYLDNGDSDIKEQDVASAVHKQSEQRVAKPNNSTGFSSRLSEHKDRIISAVQKIAGYRDEPDIDIDSYMARKEKLAKALNNNATLQPAKQQRMERIDAKPLAKSMSNIEPAAGLEAKFLKAPETKPTQKSGNQLISASFAPSQSAIGNEAKGMINAKILPRLQTNTALRLQLQSYASPTDATNSLEARRKSLSRALATREYLVSMGVNPRRIDLRPMGESTHGAPDRIDFLLYTP